jgi:hypothetical protein
MGQPFRPGRLGRGPSPRTPRWSRRWWASLALVLAAGCGQGSGPASLPAGAEDPNDQTGVQEVAATPPPVDECRELGGGWQWHGTREHGTASVGLEADEHSFDEETGEATISGAPMDNDEFAERVAEREAAGWPQKRIHQLDYVGLDYERAVEWFHYDGTRDDYEQERDQIETLLDEMPPCQAD